MTVYLGSIWQKQRQYQTFSETGSSLNCRLVWTQFPTANSPIWSEHSEHGPWIWFFFKWDLTHFRPQVFGEKQQSRVPHSASFTVKLYKLYTYIKMKAHSSLYVYFCKHCAASEVICVHCTYGSHQGFKQFILISKKKNLILLSVMWR